MSIKQYSDLYRVLREAGDQAAHGKGKQRHATAVRFTQQEGCSEAALLGIGFPVGQARKKALEGAARILPQYGALAAIHELRGSIVYLAIAILELERQLQSTPMEE